MFCVNFLFLLTFGRRYGKIVWNKPEKEDEILKNEKKAGLIYRLFNAQRNDIPDAPEEDTTPTVKRYFKLLKRRFWKLISLNLMMLPMILPIVPQAGEKFKMPQKP